MTAGTGIALAFVAMLCWGFGDFLIQKSARKLGDWETLFIITLFGSVVLLPFAWHSLPHLFSAGAPVFGILSLACIAILAGALLDLEAVRKGKLAIVEPIWSLEIVSASVLAFILFRESITWAQTILIIILLASLMLVAFKEKRLTKAIFLEKGVIIAIIAALAMGCANFFMGWGGRVTDPVMVNFITDIFLVVVSGLFLAARRHFFKVFGDLRRDFKLLIPMSVSDEAAWLAYVFSMSLVPIAVATALSESYIVIAVLLGLFVNKEKLHTHQKLGLVAALIAAIVLAAITSA